MSSKISVTNFRQAVYDQAREMKIPIVDERAIDKLSINRGTIGLEVQMKYREGEETKIKTFLAVAKYNHSIVVFKDETFFIIASDSLWRLSL
ncbi:MAG: hypothetical protein ACFFDP_08815 [Promethearchaeota archaeon]